MEHTYEVRVIFAPGAEGGLAAVEGEALVSTEPLGFLGVVDPDSGVVTEPTHQLYGQSVAGKILVFPTGKGSTVGSYTIYRLKKNGIAPLAIVNAESEPIIATGAAISDIPMVDQMDISQIQTGDRVRIAGSSLTVYRAGEVSSPPLAQAAASAGAGA